MNTDTVIIISSLISGQRIQVSCDITAVLFSYSHLRHCRVGFDVMRMLNPLHEVRRSVGKFPSNVVPVPNAIEWRAYQTSRSWHAGNRMTSVTSVFADLNSSGDRVSPTSQLAGITDFLLRKAITAAR